MYKVLISYQCVDLLIFLYYVFSKQAVFDGKKAIRGGIPFVFRKLFAHF